MSDAELHELVFLSFNQVDTNFQFFLTITFAVIAVSFLAMRHLTLFLVVIIGALYVGATAIVGIRMMIAGAMYRQYTQAIQEIPFPAELNAQLGVLRPSIMVVASISALSYLVYCYLKNVREDHEDDV